MICYIANLQMLLNKNEKLSHIAVCHQSTTVRTICGSCTGLLSGASWTIHRCFELWGVPTVHMEVCWKGLDLRCVFFFFFKIQLPVAVFEESPIPPLSSWHYIITETFEIVVFFQVVPHSYVPFVQWKPKDPAHNGRGISQCLNMVDYQAYLQKPVEVARLIDLEMKAVNPNLLLWHQPRSVWQTDSISQESLCSLQINIHQY